MNRLARIVLVCVAALTLLTVGLGQQSGMTKKRVAVLQFTTDGKPDQSREARLAAEALEGALISSNRFVMQSRIDLAAVLGQDRLAATGITNDQAVQVTERSGADWIVTGNVTTTPLTRASGGFELQVKLINRSSTELLGSAAIAARTTVDTDAAEWAKSAVRSLLKRFPLEARVKALLRGQRATLDQGVRAGLTLLDREGSIYREFKQGDSLMERFVGTFRITREGQFETGIEYQADEEVRNGDLARTGDQLPSNPPAQAVVNAVTNSSFALLVRQANERVLQDGARVKLGEEIVVEFTPRVSGEVYIVSSFPNDKEFYLLHPVNGFQTRVARSGSAFVYPSAFDVDQSGNRIRLVAQAPTGKTYLKAFVLPRAIPNLVSTLEPLSDNVLVSMVDALKAAGDLAASGEVRLEIIP